MTSELKENKDLVRRINDEVWAQGNLDLVDEHVAPGYVEHSNAAPEALHGPEGYKANVEMVRAALPDMEVETEHLVAEGDLVVNHYTITGTHDGPLMGIEPTGNEVRFSGVGIIRFADGKIVEDWGIIDIFGLMQQLGVISAD